MQYNLHEIVWDDEKVKRFWNFYNNYEAFEDLWFSKAVGKEIIGFTKKHFEVKGNVLDYGIGKGHLANYLMEMDEVNLYACDFSDETIRNINSQFQFKKNFKGAFLVKGFPSNFEENQFDFVFLIEAIEHLTDEYLIPTLEEIRRILKPNGVIVITTPNNENLQLQNVVCPDCGCVFHRVQHVRSFNKENLSNIMSTLKFNLSYCGALNFAELKKPFLFRKTKSFIRQLIGSNFIQPHLVYIGRK